MKLHKFLLLSILLILVQFALITAQPATVYPSAPPKDAETLAKLDADGHFTFLIAADLGRNGYYDQVPVAEMMGKVAAITDIEFVAAIGDVHHFEGVASINDPLWLTNFEWVYKHPELMLPWYPVLGNHEYRGNTQAVLDYHAVSARWKMTARYYAQTWSIADDVQILLLYIDTAPLIDRYRVDYLVYPDARQESMLTQLEWIDQTLAASDAKWKMVMGHHPIYAGTTKRASERLDLQERLQPLLDKYQVDISIGGHIHNFQHIQVPGSQVDYFVNSSASQTRDVVHLQGARFSSSDAGFSLCTAKADELIMTFVNKEGEMIYQYSRQKTSCEN
ncbi:metallophosphoesterase [candidate division KSB1 bacterium]|nr:metallophosphoesterase [candidate division KSB1 bacterium]